MLVKFRTNLGRMDATELKIEDFEACLVDKAVDIEDAAAEILIARGIAEQPKGKVKGVPPQPMTAPDK